VFGVTVRRAVLPSQSALSIEGISKGISTCGWGLPTVAPGGNDRQYLKMYFCWAGSRLVIFHNIHLSHIAQGGCGSSRDGERRRNGANSL